MRRVEKRANGLFLKVLGPVGTVVSIPGWMIDAIACAEMSHGAPRVHLEALSDLKRLVTRARGCHKLPEREWNRMGGRR